MPFFFLCHLSGPIYSCAILGGVPRRQHLSDNTAKLDLKDAYLQMELTNDSKDLTTVATHLGLLRMNRLPFGLSCCEDIFQAAMDRVLEGCVAYLDDLQSPGTSKQDLAENLEGVLRRLREHGIRLKKNKCHFSLEEVRCLGWIVSATT